MFLGFIDLEMLKMNSGEWFGAEAHTHTHTRKGIANKKGQKKKAVDGDDHHISVPNYRVAFLSQERF